MVGFPSETEEEYKETLEVLSHMRCLEAFMYYYNPREGTKAVEMQEQIGEEEKGRRLQELIDFQHTIFAEEKRKRCNSVVEVMVTQVSKHDTQRMLGKTEHNEMVVFPSLDAKGSMVRVQLTGLSGNTYTALPLENS
ncbi:tRNA-2-methylthio-N(6)-dimethylallyladenosine synthase [bioreactor metagenome]|uniref:tRNA-2-methylthio-N(6)-dimethylallyladenosine synthase n=1 Tax=bioreactor metagenome TaxID=1076179 RepID=A0A645C7K1_9ZZZZ